MLSIVLSGIGLAALGLSFLPNPAQGKTQGVKLSQQATDTPHTLLKVQLKAWLSQLGYTTHAPLSTTQGIKLSQLGYGHAPHLSVGKNQITEVIASKKGGYNTAAVSQ